MQVAVTFFDRDTIIPIPWRWGDYTALAVREVYMNGYYAKLLTLAPWKIEGIPDFPQKLSYWHF